VLGGSAQSALKSSKQVQRIGSRLSDTGALRALTRISDAKHALKAKATARILLTVDGGVPERLLSQDDTAGQAYRLWRLQRNNDLNVDSRPEADQSAVGEFLIRNDDDGAQVVADGDDDAVAVIRQFDEVGDDTADRLADLKRSGELDTSDLNRLENALDNGEIDARELHRISEILDESGNFRYDDDVSVEEFIELADNDELSDTVAVVKPDDTVTKDGITVDTVQLDTGDADTGQRHLLLRHVGGAERAEKPITNFWPVGQTVGGRTLPDAIDLEDIDRLTYRAIKNGDASDTGTEITYRYDNVDVEGIDEVIVKVDEQTGRVISSYPDQGGSAVDTYYGSADEWNIESE
jgi:VCBS repeat-containing protein